MDIPTRTPSNDLADQSFAVYLEPLLSSRRVAVIGNSDPLTSPEAWLDWLEGRASYVDSFESADACAEASEGEPFDAVVVVDERVLSGERDTAVRDLRYSLARDGVLALAIPGAGHSNRRRRAGSGYAIWHRRLGEAFGHVSMLGQTPMAGFALTDFDARAGAPAAVDGSLLEGSSTVRDGRANGSARPSSLRCWAVASDAELDLEGYLVVQVPPSLTSEGASLPREQAGENLVAKGALEKVEQEVSKLQAQLQQSRSDSEVQLRGERQEQDSLRAQLAKCEKALGIAERQADEALGRLGGLDRDLEKARGAHARLQKSLDKLERQAERPRKSTGEQRGRSAREDVQVEACNAEIQSLGERLRETGRRVVELEQEVHRRGLVARDLIEQLSSRAAGGGTSDGGSQSSSMGGHSGGDSGTGAKGVLSGSAGALDAETNGAEAVTCRAELARVTGQLEEERRALDAERSGAAALRSELCGARLRMEEGERALLRLAEPDPVAATSKESGVADRDEGFRQRIAELESDLLEVERARAAEFGRPSADVGGGADTQGRLVERLESESTALDGRVSQLQRELEENRIEADARLELVQKRASDALAERERLLQRSSELVATLGQTREVLSSLAMALGLSDPSPEQLLQALHVRTSDAQKEERFEGLLGRMREVERERDEAAARAELFRAKAEELNAQLERQGPSPVS